MVWKLDIQDQGVSWVGFSEAVGVPMAIFSLCTHMVFLLCVYLILLFLKVYLQSWIRTNHNDSINTIYFTSFKDLVSKYIYNLRYQS